MPFDCTPWRADPPPFEAQPDLIPDWLFWAGIVILTLSGFCAGVYLVMGLNSLGLLAP
jgi:hypothetical protein